MTTFTAETFFAHVASLEDQAEKAMDEVVALLDWEQSSDLEKDALRELVTHHRTSLTAGEWEPLTNDLLFGDFDRDADLGFTQFLDAGEMDRDMTSWEDEFACHALFASNPWSERPSSVKGTDDEGKNWMTDKKSQVKMWAKITAVGPDYMTCESEFGKVFVPKHLMRSIESPQEQVVGGTLYILSQFKGFEGARPTAMPWRAIRILSFVVHSTFVDDEEAGNLIRFTNPDPIGAEDIGVLAFTVAEEQVIRERFPFARGPVTGHEELEDQRGPDALCMLPLDDPDLQDAYQKASREILEKLCGVRLPPPSLVGP